MTGLNQAQKKLAQSLDDLFKPRGQNPRINKALAELRGTQEELKRQQLSSEEWQKHDCAYRDATGAAEQIREELRKARSEQGRLKRLRAARPAVVRRRRLAEELGELKDAVRLRDDFGAEFRRARGEFQLAENTITQASGTLKELARQLCEVNPPRLLLEASGEIESLQERLGAIDKASADRVRLDQYRQDCEHQARQILRELGRALDLDQAEELRPRADLPPGVRALGQQFAKLYGQVAEARKTITRQDDQIKRLEEQQATFKELHDVEPLRRAVRQARNLGDVDARLGEARARFKQAEKKLTTSLTRLSGWNRPVEALERLSIPLTASVDRIAALLEDVNNQKRSVAEQEAALSESIRQLETRLQSLVLQQDVPSEETLLDARTRREQGWQLVKNAWLLDAPAGDALARFLADDASGGTLASAYERSVERADELADRLRREATRVAEKAELLAQLDHDRAALAALEEEHRILDDRRAQINADWSSLVAPLAIGTASSTPAELRAWLRERDDVIQLFERLDEARQVLEPLEHASHTQTLALHQALELLGEAVTTSASSLADLLDHAETVMNRHAELMQKRAKLDTQLTAARAERSAALVSRQAADAEMTAWRTDWSAMMTRIGLDADSSPLQAEVFLTKITELFQNLNEHRSHESRIRGIDRDAVEFARDVASLVEKIMPDWASEPANVQARELARRLREAQADAQTRTTLIQQQEREDANLRAARMRLQEARVSIDRLCEEAHCIDSEQVLEAERRSRHRAQLEANYAVCEEDLLNAAAGSELASFVAEIERTDPDLLDAASRDIEAKVAALEEELRQLDQTIGTERSVLARMDGSDRAAETAEVAQTLLARIQADVSRYTTLKLAEAVLERGIESYREKNQAPILTRASVLFAKLTDSSFVKLQIDDDDDGRSVLKGVRPDGRLVGVEGMSDGSHDQLYLALRLASLESWLESHEAIPFIVDDILLNFDDLRATAALGALVQLSRRTQVLFFTHHRHIMDLARAQFGCDGVFIHELSGAGGHES